jgi:CelD/BcsL family acetyltransferase involved in cellulose biosynthesis
MASAAAAGCDRRQGTPVHTVAPVVISVARNLSHGVDKLSRESSESICASAMSLPSFLPLSSRASDTTSVRTDVTDLGELSTLRECWDGLFDAAGREPSTSFEWTSALLRHLVGPDDRTLLIRAWRDGKLAAVLPLVTRNGTFCRQTVVTLTPVAECCGTHGDLLCRDLDDVTIEALVDQLLSLNVQWECFRMTKLREGSPLTLALQRCLDRRKLTFDLRRHSAEYVITLPGSYDTYLKERSSKFRNYLGRVKGRIARKGQTAVVVVSDPNAFEAAWEHILTIERASWKHRHGSAITEVPWQERFFGEVWKEAMRRERVEVQFLTLNGQPIAYNVGYIQGRTYSYLKTSYDGAFRYESPATLLRARLIEQLIARGITSVEFPGPAFEWEQQWTDEVRWYQELWLYNRTPLARLMSSMQRWMRPGEAERIVKHIDPRDPDGDLTADVLRSHDRSKR